MRNGQAAKATDRYRKLNSGRENRKLRKVTFQNFSNLNGRSETGYPLEYGRVVEKILIGQSRWRSVRYQERRKGLPDIGK